MSEKAGAQMGPPAYSADQPQPLQPGQPEPAWQPQQQQPQPQQQPQQQQAPAVFQPAGTTVVVQQQPGLSGAPPPYVPSGRMEPFPVRMQCPHCRTTVTTVTTKQSGLAVWASCCTMAFLGLWLGCCLIPFCVDGLKDTVHTCPVCKVQLGKHAIIS